MPLRPLDEDVLTEICIDLATNHYGFLYVDEVSGDIADEYESSDVGMLNAQTVGRSDLKAFLKELASNPDENFERLRPGVYFRNPFGRDDREVFEVLAELFAGRQQVVTVEQIRNQFGIAPDDIEFFITELEKRGYLFRIAAGSEKYYSVGSKLEEDHGQNLLEDELRDRSLTGPPLGQLSHDELEEIIQVSATSDVIHYLERNEELIIDLDGEYLIRDTIEAYGEWLAQEIADDIAEELEAAGYAMHTNEYEEVAVSAVENRTDVLDQVGPEHRSDVVKNVVTALDDELNAERDDGIVVHREPFENEIDAHAERIVQPVLGSGAAATPTAKLAEVESDIESLQIADAEATNKYLQRRVHERAEELIREDF